MNIQRISLEEKIITGICIRTNNKKAKDDISKLWNEFYTNKIVSKINDRLADSFIYGVYNDYESDMNSDYTVTVGVQIHRKDIKKNNVVKLKKGKYILFENQGELPEIVIQTWEKIWEYFEENKDIKRKYTSDFEVYESDKNIKIYIAIK